VPNFRSVEDDAEEKIKGALERIRTDMPEHFEPRCKVCTSPYRHAIERMIALNTSFSEIERIFAGEDPGHPDVPRRSVSKHAKEHLNWENAAIRAIVEHEARQQNVSAEIGMSGALRRHAYLSAGVQKAWEDLVDGRARIDPAVAIQMIQQLEKMEQATAAAANEELHMQFNAFKSAVQRVVPREMWGEIFEETRRIIERGDTAGELEASE